MRPAHRPEALEGRVFRARDVLAHGVLTPRALRSSAWRRLYRGVYADAAIPESFGLRVRGASLIAPHASVFTGRTAAYLHGATELADLRTPVEITVPPRTSFGPVTGLRIRHAHLHSSDVVTIARRRCTTELATALAIAADEPVTSSVPALDIFVRRGLINGRELSTAAGALTGRRSCRTRQAVEHVDARAESQPESTLRVVLALAGIVTVPQFSVRDGRHSFVARVDLAIPELKLAIEYDGAWHGDAPQLTKDRRRMNALTTAGWRVLFVTAADMRDTAALVAKVRAFIAAATSGNSSF